MALTLNPARQDVKFAHVDISYADLASGTTQAVIKLPPLSQILSGAVVVTTAVNSGTSDVVTVGDVTNTARYLGSTSIHAAGSTALVPTFYLTTLNEPFVTISVTSVGAAATAGAMRVQVSYTTHGVAESTMG